MGSGKPAITLDMSGLSCPSPLIGAKKIVDCMQGGQTMLLISDCPGTADDLFAWSRHTGNDVESTQRIEEGKTAYVIRRGHHPQVQSPNVTLDMRGATCPGPVVEAKKLLDAMKPGEVLLLISNCPGAPSDINAWIKTSALELVDRIEIAPGTYEFFLRKI